MKNRQAIYLTADEIADIWLSLQSAASVLKQHAKDERFSEVTREDFRDDARRTITLREKFRDYVFNGEPELATTFNARITP